MEENTFTPNGAPEIPDIYGKVDGIEDNAITRWLYPDIAENKQFEMENYFVDKANAMTNYMFDKAAQYNSPQNQMKMAKAAGINPMLAAGNISGATAGAMQGAKGNAPTMREGINPIEQIGIGASTISTLATGANELGKIFGFGEQNKADIQVARNTATKIQEEAGLTKEEKRRLIATFDDFCKEMHYNAEGAEQNFKNLQQLYDKYVEETEKTRQETNLIKEEINTQKEETEIKRQERWTLEFKKKFRDLFGVQLNDSDASMLAQLLLGGHGQQVMDALGNMVGSIIDGIINTIRNQGQERAQGIRNFINDNLSSENRRSRNAARQRQQNYQRNRQHLRDVYYENSERGRRLRQQYESFDDFEQYFWSRNNHSTSNSFRW